MDATMICYIVVLHAQTCDIFVYLKCPLYLKQRYQQLSTKYNFINSQSVSMQ